MTLNETKADAGLQEAARHLAEGRAGEAAAVLERLVGAFPAYVTAHVLLAKAYEGAGRRDDALRAWHDAYFLLPGSPLIARERARLLHGGDGAEDAPLAPEASAAAQPGGGLPEVRIAFDDPEPEEPPVDAGLELAGAGLEEPVRPFDVAPAQTEPPRPARAPALPEGIEDLDTLIHQLENAPRIKPDADFPEEAAEPGEDDDDEMVSETLARIYEAQRQFEAAARAYEQLAERHPGRADELRRRAGDLRRRAEAEGQG